MRKNMPARAWCNAFGENCTRFRCTYVCWFARAGIGYPYTGLPQKNVIHTQEIK
jgi:hypothetical protein